MKVHTGPLAQADWAGYLNRMMTTTRRKFISGVLAGIGAAGLALDSRNSTAQNHGFSRSSLTIVSANGRHKFNIEMALTNRQQSQGLMFRRFLAPDAGMMFDYIIPQIITMWMKNTFIPLDMIFVGVDGRVVNIVERTVPHSTMVIPSVVPARAVIEINGGTAARLGIKRGDLIEHRIFGTGQ